MKNLLFRFSYLLNEKENCESQLISPNDLERACTTKRKKCELKKIQKNSKSSKNRIKFFEMFKKNQLLIFEKFFWFFFLILPC